MAGPNKSFESLITESVVGEFSTLINTTSELENLDANISQGDTVAVAQPETPYRTSDWIDIETDDVTIIFESKWAADGQPIVKVADGAGVGGVRIGNSTTTEDVTVKNYGYHGNKNNQDQSVKRLHGVIIGANATDITIKNGFATRTSPYQNDPAGSAHDDGGSGFTVRVGASEVDFIDCETTDIGDRGFQIAGSEVRVLHPKTRDGFDRSVAFNVTQPDGNQYHGRDITVIGGDYANNIEGSVHGVGSPSDNPTNDPAENITIVGCQARGTFRRFLRVSDGATNISCVGCVVDQTGTDLDTGFLGSTSGANDITISGGSYSGVGSGGPGLDITDSGGITVSDLDISNVGKAATVIGCSDVDFSGCDFNGQSTVVDIFNSTDVGIDGGSVDGGNTATECVKIKNSDSVTLDGVRVRRANFPNVQVVVDDGNTHTDIQIMGCNVQEAGGKGIVVNESSGTVNHYVITNNISRNNGGANLEDGGSGTSKTISGNIAP